MWVVKPNFWVQLTAIKCKKLTNLKPSKKREHTKMWNGSLKDELRTNVVRRYQHQVKNGKYHSSENFYDLCFYLVCRPADSSVEIKSLKKKYDKSTFRNLRCFAVLQFNLTENCHIIKGLLLKVLKGRNFPTTHLATSGSETVILTILQALDLNLYQFSSLKIGSNPSKNFELILSLSRTDFT